MELQQCSSWKRLLCSVLMEKKAFHLSCYVVIRGWANHHPIRLPIHSPQLQHYLNLIEDHHLDECFSVLLRYRDEEGDEITIRSDEELELAFESLSSQTSQNEVELFADIVLRNSNNNNNTCSFSSYEDDDQDDAEFC
ncbi:hypothetical protein C9374_014130 [Naegleria lovaniensis]|uniref:PB1 domain-containing protein n=1 Tax=Naegleria lovaniensis TaxID=51637 RepID=A0AA88GVA9_NAELO|nr:uncharacterized protein C9374_014130 [Naegleria lovaniensis]KAG2389570.1 hypothetical protein C9374_014130 [Naegleria lovaniensis]